MKCIILAAGFGTRAYPLTKDRAKCLLPVRHRPIIEHIISKLELLEDLTEIFIITNSRFYKHFESWLERFPNSIPIKLIDDGSMNHKDKLGAVKDLAFACSKEKIDDDLLVVGGDNLFSFPLNGFIDFARQFRRNSSIGVYNLDGKLQPNKFGHVRLNADAQVIDFCEKPKEVDGSGLVSMCLYYFPKEKSSLIKEYLNQASDSDRIGSYIQWLSKKDTVYGYTFEGTWFDIGDIDSYTEAVFTF